MRNCEIESGIGTDVLEGAICACLKLIVQTRNRSFFFFKWYNKGIIFIF